MTYKTSRGAYFPHIHVSTVNRCTLVPSLQLRVVTQEDVQFTRFRRDQVGIFELKEMIETNAASVAVLEAGAQHLADTL